MSITTSDEAVPTDEQPTKPCHDCPWRRKAAKGWLGPATAKEWIEFAHGDIDAPCHALKGPACAGLAIYRANVFKLPRNRDALRLPKDRDTVFDNPQQFLDYHQPTKGKI